MKNVVIQILHNFSRSCRKLLGAGPMELTVIVPAYLLHFRFLVQNKIHKQQILSDTRTGILGSIAGSCDFLPARSDSPTNFKKSAIEVKMCNVTDR
jgi:hypothetical protein